MTCFMDILLIAVLIVFLGLVFDYTNGFHDAANVVATVIATRVLAPVSAIVLAGILNTVGALQMSRVAETITSGIIETALATPLTVLAGLVGAIIWNIFTWYIGMPSSSSYALIGGLVGASVMTSGFESILWKGVFSKVIIPMICSPFIGFFLAFLLMKSISLFILRKKNGSGKEKVFSHLQIGSACVVALAHGLNDAQKSMGLITLGLFSSGFLLNKQVPFWVIISCALVMGLGTATGGMRIIHTVGFSITKLKPVQGFAAELSASVIILLASFLGMPISSTHMMVGSVTGVGASDRFSSVRWSTIQRLICVWVFSLPGSALVGAFCSKGILYFF